MVLFKYKIKNEIRKKLLELNLIFITLSIMCIKLRKEIFDAQCVLKKWMFILKICKQLIQTYKLK